MKGLSPLQVPWVQEGMALALSGCWCVVGGSCRASIPGARVSSGSTLPWAAPACTLPRPNTDILWCWGETPACLRG